MEMSGYVRVPPSVYLDNAATTFPKPPCVVRAVRRILETDGGNPGRGAHRMSLAAAREVYACRETAARLFGLSHPERVIFTGGATQAVNMAVKGLLRPGDRAVCSDMEHNAVFRVLAGLESRGICRYDTFETLTAVPGRTDEVLLSVLRHRLAGGVRMLVCAHASNIVPAVLPLEKIGALCREMGALFIVDAAQSAGVYDIDMEAMHIDALCVPGHKGLMGPMGVGMLLLGEGVDPDVLLEGGNGVGSLSADMGEDIPEKYEAGTLPLPAIAGLRAGMEYVMSVTPEAVREKETRLGMRLRDGLLSLPGVRVGAPHLGGGTVLFTVDGQDSEETAVLLDASRPGICVRPGYHCAALAHRTLGTPAGGAVRASFGWFNTARDADAALRAVGECVRHGTRG